MAQMAWGATVLRVAHHWESLSGQKISESNWLTLIHAAFKSDRLIATGMVGRTRNALPTKGDALTRTPDRRHESIASMPIGTPGITRSGDCSQNRMVQEF